MRDALTRPRNKKLIVALLLSLFATTCLWSAYSIGGLSKSSQYPGLSSASATSVITDRMGPSIAISLADRIYSIFGELANQVLTDGATFSDKVSYSVSQLIQSTPSDGAAFSDQISYSLGQPIQGSPTDNSTVSDKISYSLGGSQNGSALVSSGSVSIQTFPITGISVSISGTAGTTASINTTRLTAQPSNTGSVPLGSTGGAGLGFYDLSLSGVTGGTAHACISSTLVDSKTVLDFYSAGSWIEAATISDTPATSTAPGMVCGSIAVSALTGTPLVIGDPQSGTTISTPSVSGTSSTTSGTATTTGSSSPGYLIYVGGIVVILIILIAAVLVRKRR